MISSLDNPPVPDPRRPILTLGTQSLVHVRSICPIHIATDGTFGLVCILSMIGPRYSAITATLLAVRIEVTDFDGLTAAIQPFNLNIGFIHGDRFSQRPASPAAPGNLPRQRRRATRRLVNALVRHWFYLCCHQT